jgi:hypothetical protein
MVVRLGWKEGVVVITIFLIIGILAAGAILRGNVGIEFPIEKISLTLEGYDYRIIKKWITLYISNDGDIELSIQSIFFDEINLTKYAKLSLNNNVIAPGDLVTIIINDAESPQPIVTKAALLSHHKIEITTTTGENFTFTVLAGGYKASPFKFIFYPIYQELHTVHRALHFSHQQSTH